MTTVVERDTEESEDRARVIAYLALCELRDLDPAGEPEHFSQTRRDLAADTCA